jgi:hypothetical protein
VFNYPPFNIFRTPDPAIEHQVFRGQGRRLKWVSFKIWGAGLNLP